MKSTYYYLECSNCSNDESLPENESRADTQHFKLISTHTDNESRYECNSCGYLFMHNWDKSKQSYEQEC